MVALKCVMCGDYQLLPRGKSRAGNILRKNHCVCWKHPTQKPLCVLSRIIQASTLPGAWILDPFTGSSTTGIAANLLGRRFLGIDQNEEFLEMSKARREEINDVSKRVLYLEKLQKQAQLFEDKEIHFINEPFVEYGQDLPF